MTAPAIHTRSRADAASTAIPKPPRRGRVTKGTTRKVVVIGNGMASHKVCQRLVSNVDAGRFEITVFGEEPSPAYDRVHLTEFLGGKSADDLLLAPRGWYQEQGITLHTGDPIVSIDRNQRIVRSASGHEVPYDKLVFATGSRAFIPPFPGNHLPGVFVYRTLEDLERIREHARTCRRAAVMGGGLLGVEAAKALKDLGLDTFIIEHGTNILARQLDPEGGQRLREHVERLGLHVCTSRQTTSIEPLDRDLLLQFHTGECLRTQLVVLAVGIRPRDELAASCGLTLGPRGGIQVNDRLESSDPAIHAIGECAVHRGITYGLAAPGHLMADTLAAILAGSHQKFTGADQSAWLKLAGIAVATLGEFQQNEETLTFRTPSLYRRLVLRKGRLIGGLGVGEWPEQNRMLEAIGQQRRLWRWQRARFLKQGRVWSEKAVRPVNEWPAGAIICNCTGMRRGQLSAACEGGCQTVEQLAVSTGASTICGSCRPLLAEMVGLPAQPQRLPGHRVLLHASWIALLLCVLTAVIEPFPVRDSVQSGWSMEFLLHDATAKQISGFTLLGLMALGMVFSLRKRVRFLSQLGEVGGWKAFHGALGALSLIVLVTHTGFRLGQNLNLVLMLNFLALALAGSLAGGVTALERYLPGPAARRLRAIWTALHIAVAWPLPVLIAFHIFAAYYY